MGVKKMRLLLIAVLSSMILVAACAQQAPQPAPPAPPATQPTPPTPPPAPAPEPEEEVEEAVEEETEAEVVSPSSGDEIRILGKDGFDPMETTVSAGSTVTWINEHDKDITITMFKDGKFFQNSPVINPGEKFDQAFEEAGEYEYWTLAFGPLGAKVTVE